MSKTEKKKFVKRLTKSIIDPIIALIDMDKIPAEWDGCELRAYLAEKFQQSASYSSVTMGRARKKAYNNAIITTSEL